MPVSQLKPRPHCGNPQDGVCYGRMHDDVIYECGICGDPWRPHCDGTNHCCDCGHHHDKVRDGHQQRWWIPGDPPTDPPEGGGTPPARGKGEEGP